MTLQLIDLTIHNFGPYYGEQTLEFGLNQPVVVIHGENMRGKTSLLNAIRWVLYGNAVDRFGQRMDLLKLINWDAANLNDWTMSVKLRFNYDNIPYDLTRAVQLKTQGTPQRDDHFDQKTFLIKNYNHLNMDEAITEINRILPEKTSRFFLFDGELLNEYEVLLAKPETQSSIINESIEYILGVPSVTNSIADLKGNLREAKSWHNNLAKKDKAAKGLAREAANLQDEIEKLEFDFKELNAQKDELELQKNRLNEELQSTKGIEADALRLKDIEERINKLQEQEKQALENRRVKLIEAWRDLVQPSINDRIRVLETEKDIQFQKLRDTERINNKLKDIQSLLSQEKCPTCGQLNPHIDRFDLESKKLDLENQLREINYDENKYAFASASIRQLRLLKPATVIEDIKFIERQLSEIKVNLVDLWGKKEELNDRLKNFDYVSVVRNRREYDRKTEELGRIKLVISEGSRVIAEKKTKEEKLRKQIIKISGPEMYRANREVEIYQDLISLFERTLLRLRNDLKEVVQKDASDIFLQLTTDKSYTGLRSNDFYGLTILDANQQEVPVRSAGAEQIVALSLIGALNRNAVRNGPIIMDTPFGRLDKKHRENILKFIPTFSNQVVLLVHGGEINRERDLDMIKDRIEREYEIKSISSRRSSLIPIKEI